MNESGRTFAGIVAAMALLALILQYSVAASLPDLPDADAVLWRMTAYFTILTNIAVMAQMTAVALGADMSARRAGGLTVAIVAVAVVYHTLLAGLWQPRGIAWWADQGLHTAVPAYMALFWLMYAHKSALRYRDALLWALWPVAYGVYATLRGAITGFYPYPFLDPELHGPLGVLWRVTLLTIFYVMGGLLLVLLGRLIRTHGSAHPSA